MIYAVVTLNPRRKLGDTWHSAKGAHAAGDEALDLLQNIVNNETLWPVRMHEAQRILRAAGRL